MSQLDRIEIHEFTYETPNLGLDSSGFNLVYQPGGKLPLSKFAIVIRTADGARGEYVALWGGTKMALGADPGARAASARARSASARTDLRRLQTRACGNTTTWAWAASISHCGISRASN